MSPGNANGAQAMGFNKTTQIKLPIQSRLSNLTSSSKNQDHDRQPDDDEED